MKLLALDSSGLVASVAVLNEDTVLAEYTVNHKKTHSQTLLPMIDEIMRMLDMDIKEIDAIALSGGPGSFTGLRIGSATAKGLGMALDRPLIAVPTVDALACNLSEVTGSLIVPMMDARREQVYTGIYKFDSGRLQVLHEQWPAAVTELAEILNERGEQAVLLGDGVPVYKNLLDELLKIPFRTAPSHLNRQRAGAVGFLALQYLAEGKTVTAAEHVPEYLRLSQAERERTKLAYMELQNIKNRGGRFINTGTPWHKDDAFSIMPKPKRFDCYSTGIYTPYFSWRNARRRIPEKRKFSATPGLSWPWIPEILLISLFWGTINRKV